MRKSEAYAEDKLLLASIVTVPSNGFFFHYCIIGHSGHNTMSTVPGQNNKLSGPFVNCQEQRQQRPHTQQSSILSINCIEQYHQKNYSVVNL
jgi:hypothetical protein